MWKLLVYLFTSNLHIWQQRGNNLNLPAAEEPNWYKETKAVCLETSDFLFQCAGNPKKPDLIQDLHLNLTLKSVLIRIRFRTTLHHYYYIIYFILLYFIHKQ